MKPKSINYQKVFPLGMYVNEKIGIEVELGELDTPEEALNYAKDIVESWHKQSNPQLQLGTTTTEVVTPDVPLIPKTNEDRKKEAIDGWITTINSMTTLSGLKNLSPLVEKTPELQDAYNQKLQSLTK